MTDTNLPRKEVYKKIKSNASIFFYFVAEKLKYHNYFDTMFYFIRHKALKSASLYPANIPPP